ncbi:FtsK/SpoIIIE family protein [Nocardioidaceae bacterium Broad-1]|nr:FtsK/SpoIIIE family protein [Nocardioidaceae bacterium Broad-1]
MTIAATAGGTRTEEPEVPEGELALNAPPAIEEGEGVGGVLMNAIPMLGSLGSIVLVATMQPAGGTGGGAPIQKYLAAGMFLFATLGFIFVQIDRQRKQKQKQVGGQRTDYLRYLAGVRQSARKAGEQQRKALTWHYPAPSSLPSIAEERSRLWERPNTHKRFLDVRYGVAHQPLALTLVPPQQTPIDQVDPASASALHRLLTVHRVQPDLPAATNLRGFDKMEICGNEDQARALARALICGMTAFHSPEQLIVAVLTSERNLAEWDWVKWLPHAQSGREVDAVGPRRMVVTNINDLAALLPTEVGERARWGTDDRIPSPQVVVIVDGGSVPPGNHVLPDDGIQGVTVIDLPTHWDELFDSSRVRFLIDDEEPDENNTVPGYQVRVRMDPVRLRVDQMSMADAEAYARRLTALYTVAPEGSDAAAETPQDTEIAAPKDYMALLGLGDVRSFDPEVAWRPRANRDRLRVPVGVGEAGQQIYMDIKESAQQGMGPHGLVIGATGSGKSEFLRTLVLGLVLTHPPEVLNLVLVDFKGGATFAGMAGMPHVSAVITNLEGELTLVDRMQDALSGEMTRRQELLREAGNFSSLKDYEKARTQDPSMDPLPSLFIVVDEFSEMLSAKPEFIDLFVAIGRLGRSLGIHLLLASQRLEEGRLRGLDSHLSYRVGLRTFSAQESRTVLGVPDAYELPAVPGLGYLKPDPTSMQRFRAAYVSGPPAAGSRIRRDEGGKLQGIFPFSIAEVKQLAMPVEEEERPAAPVVGADGVEKSMLDIAVERMTGHGRPAHQVWLPPLDIPDTLDSLMPDLTTSPELGLHSPAWKRLGGLVVPLGIVDKPREQLRDTLTVDLRGAAGHVAVIGAPRTGKSTTLRTIVTSMSLTMTPQEVQFFVLDFGGGTFAPLAKLPHVSGLGTRSEPDVVRRVLAEISGIIDRREAYFRAQGIDSIETYRTRRARGQADDGWGDVFLVIDGWGTLRADFDDLEYAIQEIAPRGLTFGVHIVAAAGRWAEFRSSMRDVFGTKLELRLGDPMDSELDRKLAALVPTGRPGRGIVKEKLHFLSALPRMDGDGSAATLGDGVDDLISRVSAAWEGPAGPKLRLLPEQITIERIREQAGVTEENPGKRLLLGINEKELAPVGLDPDAEPHLLVFGDGQSGKSTLLRNIAREIMRTHSPKEAQIAVVDYRRSMLGEIPDDYLVSYLTSATQATPALSDLADYLSKRIPGPDVTPEQLRNRSWWTGADLFLLVDDYDLVATQQGSPVAPLQPLMAQARDVGLHVIIARRSGGASRSLYESVIQSMRDLAMPGLLLSGNPDEGPLIGNLKPVPTRPGRGRLVTRDRGIEVVQLAWSESSV